MKYCICLVILTSCLVASIASSKADSEVGTAVTGYDLLGHMSANDSEQSVSFEHNQECLGTRGVYGNRNDQISYKMRCLKCHNEYGANGCDVWERRCPECQNGSRGNCNY